MRQKIGEILTEELRKKPVPVIPALKILGKTSLKEEKAELTIHQKTKNELPRVSENNLLRFGPGEKQISARPLKVGVLFSGGPAAGGQNVIAGLFDALKEINPRSEVIGFLDGPEGLLKGEAKVLTPVDIDEIRNQGGFYLLGTSRTKFEKEEDLSRCLRTIKKFDLDGLLIIGGDDSNTNAAHLANYLKNQGSKTSVVGLPKTIDGDLAFLPYLETSFGFHTASRIYSEMVGNIARDLPSSRKIWHFVKLMGRSASWITLEVAFQTQPNVALIGEEIKQKKMTLAEVVDSVCQVIGRRYLAGKKYGLVLIPEGIVEFIPEIKNLISQINKAIVKIGNENFIKISAEERKEKVLLGLDNDNKNLFLSLPHPVQNGLLSGLDPHGNVQVSQIASDVLIMELCSEKLAKTGFEINGQKVQTKLTTQAHFYGYDGRCGYPTWFDATYTYNLGRAASVLVAQNKTGYMVAIQNLAKSLDKWQPLALPLAGMMAVEERKGKDALVIAKYLVNLESPAFKEFAKNRENWALDDNYLCPGPVQYWGPEELVQDRAATLVLNSGS